MPEPKASEKIEPAAVLYAETFAYTRRINPPPDGSTSYRSWKLTRFYDVTGAPDLVPCDSEHSTEAIVRPNQMKLEWEGQDSEPLTLAFVTMTGDRVRKKDRKANPTLGPHSVMWWINHPRPAWVNTLVQAHDNVQGPRP